METFNIRMQSENINYVDLSKKLIPDYLIMINDKNISRFISTKDKLYTYENEFDWVCQKLKEKALIFSMIERKTNNFIGNVELMNVTDDSAEIGISITANYQNKHYGSEAMNMIIDYSFNKLKLKELRLIVFSHNQRAIHLYEKLGFIQYKIEKNVAVIDGKTVDDIYMKLNHKNYLC